MPIAVSGSTGLVVVVAPAVAGVAPLPVVVVGAVADLSSPQAAPIKASATNAAVSFEIVLDRMGPPLSDFCDHTTRDAYPAVTTSVSSTSGSGPRRTGIRGRIATNFDRIVRTRFAKPPG